MVGSSNVAGFGIERSKSSGNARQQDVERGLNGRNKPNLFRFKDAARTALHDRRREDLKQKILGGVESVNIEQYRKSDDELKEIKNKKVKKYYQEQNARLDDWAEVDAAGQGIG